MIVYADVLIVLNLTVDYFLLLFSAKLLRKQVKAFRLLLGAAVGAVSSLYIFLPKSLWIIEISVRIVICLLMCLAAFGYSGIKPFLRGTTVIFAVTFGYAGMMMAFWMLLRPGGMVINNSVVYFDISPLVLIGSSVIGYFIVILIRRLIERGSPDAKVCRLEITAMGRAVNITALIDTGNSIEDIIGNGEVIIADRTVVNKLFGERVESDIHNSRYRLLPCNTVSGDGMLEGYRCDKATVICSEKSIKLDSPILAISKTRLDSECPAIINPRVLDEL